MIRTDLVRRGKLTAWATWDDATRCLLGVCWVNAWPSYLVLQIPLLTETIKIWLDPGETGAYFFHPPVTLAFGEGK